MADATDGTRPWRTHREIVTPLILVSGLVALGVAAHYLVSAGYLLTDSVGAHNLGAWVDRFSTSPAVAGIAAVLAASIAASAVIHQVRNQRAGERNRAWWTSFEWAADRALATDGVELPRPVATDTLLALFQAAENDVQRAACDGLVRHLKDEAKDEAAAAAAASSGASVPEDFERFVSSLSRWSDATSAIGRGKAWTTEFLYEETLVTELIRLVEAGELKRVARLSGRSGADAEVELRDGRSIRIEAAAGAASFRRVRNRIVHQVETTKPLLVVAGRLGSEARGEDGFAFVAWDGPEDNERLLNAIRANAR